MLQTVATLLLWSVQPDFFFDQPNKARGLHPRTEFYCMQCASVPAAGAAWQDTMGYLAKLFSFMCVPLTHNIVLGTQVYYIHVCNPEGVLITNNIQFWLLIFSCFTMAAFSFSSVLFCVLFFSCFTMAAFSFFSVFFWPAQHSNRSLTKSHPHLPRG